MESNHLRTSVLEGYSLTPYRSGTAPCYRAALRSRQLVATCWLLAALQVEAGRVKCPGVAVIRIRFRLPFIAWLLSCCGGRSRSRHVFGYFRYLGRLLRIAFAIWA